METEGANLPRVAHFNSDPGSQPNGTSLVWNFQHGDCGWVSISSQKVFLEYFKFPQRSSVVSPRNCSQESRVWVLPEASHWNSWSLISAICKMERKLPKSSHQNCSQCKLDAKVLVNQKACFSYNVEMLAMAVKCKARVAGEWKWVLVNLQHADRLLRESSHSVACSSRFKAAGAAPYLPPSFNHPCRSMKDWVRHEKADFVGVQDYFCFRVTSSSFKKEANKYSETLSWREGVHLLARRQAEQNAWGCSSAYRKLGWCCCPGGPAWLPQLG